LEASEQRMSETAWERGETDEEVSEAVGHSTILVMFWDCILATVVEIRDGVCRDQRTVLTGRSLRERAGDSSGIGWH